MRAPLPGGPKPEEPQPGCWKPCLPSAYSCETCRQPDRLPPLAGLEHVGLWPLYPLVGNA
ncbi:hypothetical protein P7K49_024434, partial [Saguinus oedipus]